MFMCFLLCFWTFVYCISYVVCKRAYKQPIKTYTELMNNLKNPPPSAPPISWETGGAGEGMFSAVFGLYKLLYTLYRFWIGLYELLCVLYKCSKGLYTVLRVFYRIVYSSTGVLQGLYRSSTRILRCPLRFVNKALPCLNKSVNL